MERIVGGVTRVVVGRGNAPSVADDLPGPAAVLCQPGSEGVATAIASAAGGLVVRVLPDGEESKRLAVVDGVVEWLAGAGIRRDGAVIGVGGGALTDAAGFIASVYLRGVESRFLPTTVLGAVDASIGGKNGINVAGKNLVGTFTHPRLVVVDLDVLDTNPPALRADGLAEAIKAGAIADPVLLDHIAAGGVNADLGPVVERSIAVKAGVVDGDFTEQHRRAILNFGHTVGHAIEYLSGWSHGRSVAVGLVAACAASERVTGFTETARIVGAVEAVGLPTRAPDLDPQDVLDLMGKDKKVDAGGVRMVLLEAIGAPVVSHVDSATLGVALAAVGIGGS